MNISSNKIQIFPFGTNRASDPYARVMNEQNITRIVKGIVDKSSYVIDYNSVDNIIEFMIEGYYFKADLTEVLEDSKFNTSPVYANIQLKLETSNGASYRYIAGNDNEAQKFTGVTFSTEEMSQTDSNFTSLWLLDYNSHDNTHEVPLRSRERLNMSSMIVDVINCGSATELID